MRNLRSWLRQKLHHGPTGMVTEIVPGVGWLIVKLAEPINGNPIAVVDDRAKGSSVVQVNQEVYIVAFRPEREDDILWIEKLG